MYTRVKELRNRLKLSQNEFGKRIGLSRDNVANIEGNRSEIKDTVVKFICREFNVSETWLRTGRGEMFAPQSRDQQIETFLRGLISTPEDTAMKRLIRAISKLSEDDIAVIDRIAREMVEQAEKGASEAAERKEDEPYDPSLPVAAHDREDIEQTDEDRKHDDDIMNDDSEW